MEAHLEYMKAGQRIPMNLYQEVIQTLPMMTTSVSIVLLLAGMDYLLRSHSMMTHNLKLHISGAPINIF